MRILIVKIKDFHCQKSQATSSGGGAGGGGGGGGLGAIVIHQVYLLQLKEVVQQAVFTACDFKRVQRVCR